MPLTTVAPVLIFPHSSKTPRPHTGSNIAHSSTSFSPSTTVAHRVILSGERLRKKRSPLVFLIFSGSMPFDSPQRTITEHLLPGVDGFSKLRRESHRQARVMRLIWAELTRHYSTSCAVQAVLRPDDQQIVHYRLCRFLSSRLYPSPISV